MFTFALLCVTRFFMTWLGSASRQSKILLEALIEQCFHSNAAAELDLSKVFYRVITHFMLQMVTPGHREYTFLLVTM